MSDDIVTRLRERAEERKEANDKYWRGYKFDYEIPELEDKAADEIERLRELLWKYENCEMVRESPCDIDWEGGECETCDKHRKAVRGE